MTPEEKAAAFKVLSSLRDIQLEIPCPCMGCQAALHGEDRKCLVDAIKKEEMINHPKHYQGKNLQSIDVIEDFELNFNLGNAVKYVLRAGKKDDKVQDLKKAIWYLERECKLEISKLH